MDFRLQRGEDPLRFLKSGTHSDSARSALTLLSKFPELYVFMVKHHRPDYTCWCVSGPSDEPWSILYFTLRPNGNFDVEFNRPSYLPRDVSKRLTRQNATSKKATVPSQYSVDQVASFIDVYLKAIVGDLTARIVKPRDRSDAERDLVAVLGQLVDITQIERNYTPAWLRSSRGRSPSLDIHIGSKSVAIEVQGPQHFKDLYGRPDQLAARQQNDLRKVRACLRNRFSIVWMEWGALSRDLHNADSESFLSGMRAIFTRASSTGPIWLLWNGIGTLVSGPMEDS